MYFKNVIESPVPLGVIIDSADFRTRCSARQTRRSNGIGNLSQLVTTRSIRLLPPRHILLGRDLALHKYPDERTSRRTRFHLKTSLVVHNFNFVHRIWSQYLRIDPFGTRGSLDFQSGSNEFTGRKKSSVSLPTFTG